MASSAENETTPSSRRKRKADRAIDIPNNGLDRHQPESLVDYSTSSHDDSVTETLDNEVLLSNWEPMKSCETWRAIRLDKENEKFKREYYEVETSFYSSMNFANDEIVQIDRIQNPFYYKQYSIMMESQEEKNSIYERKLWHGTSVQRTPCGIMPLVSICSNGFNRNYSGSATGNVYGDGVYFAVNASLSAKYSLPDMLGNRFILFCRVYTGDYTTGIKGIKTPPIKDIETQQWYDSVCDNTTAPTMFVIFSDVQAYPTHLVIFRQRSNLPLSSCTWSIPSLPSLQTSRSSSPSPLPSSSLPSSSALIQPGECRPNSTQKTQESNNDMNGIKKKLTLHEEANVRKFKSDHEHQTGKEFEEDMSGNHIVDDVTHNSVNNNDFSLTNWVSSPDQSQIDSDSNCSNSSNSSSSSSSGDNNRIFSRSGSTVNRENVKCEANNNLLVEDDNDKAYSHNRQASSPSDILLCVVLWLCCFWPSLLYYLYVNKRWQIFCLSLKILKQSRHYLRNVCEKLQWNRRQNYKLVKTKLTTAVI